MRYMYAFYAFEILRKMVLCMFQNMKYEKNQGKFRILLSECQSINFENIKLKMDAMENGRNGKLRMKSIKERDFFKLTNLLISCYMFYLGRE